MMFLTTQTETEALLLEQIGSSSSSEVHVLPARRKSLSHILGEPATHDLSADQKAAGQK